MQKQPVKLANLSCSGGRAQKNANGQEVFVIPVRKAKPSKLEQCRAPGPVANSKFSQAEMAQIKSDNK